MAENKPKILIVEDDLDVADMLNAYFRVQGYDAHAVNWGEDGFRAAQTTDPDLIILDIRLPDIDGFEVARRLRTTRKTQNIPIIFLTEKRDRTDRLHGLELGADDYITKPFDVQELRLRVRNALKRANQDTLTNPVTGLPDGSLVEEKMRECVQRDGWALLLVSIINVDKFRESYGFVASDDVMRAVSLMVHNAMRDAGAAEGFLGHFSAYDFVLLALPGMVPALEERIRSRLEQSLDYFYPLRDRDQLVSRTDRLRVKVSRLLAGERPITSLEDIKTELLNRKSKT